jgi:anti-sigma-K factor RskA
MSDWLGMSVPPRAPRPELRERVLSRARLPRRSPNRMLAAAAILVLALAGTWWVLGERATLTRRVAALADTLGLLRSTGTRPVHIPVTVEGRAGAVTIFADPASHRWLVSCHNLAPNQPDEAYQLWFVTSRGYVSAKVMPMASPAPMTMVLEAPDDTTRVLGAAMSVEPRSGSRVPTGPVVFERIL